MPKENVSWPSTPLDSCLTAHSCPAFTSLSTVQLPLRFKEKTGRSCTYHTGPGAELMTLMQDAGV